MPEPFFARSLERLGLVGHSRQTKEPLDHERLPSAHRSSRASLIRHGRLRAAFNPVGNRRSPSGGDGSRGYSPKENHHVR